jgi:hypothetical protein
MSYALAEGGRKRALVLPPQSAPLARIRRCAGVPKGPTSALTGGRRTGFRGKRCRRVASPGSDEGSECGDELDREERDAGVRERGEEVGGDQPSPESMDPRRRRHPPPGHRHYPPQGRRERERKGETARETRSRSAGERSVLAEDKVLHVGPTTVTLPKNNRLPISHWV